MSTFLSTIQIALTGNTGSSNIFSLGYSNFYLCNFTREKFKLRHGNLVFLPTRLWKNSISNTKKYSTKISKKPNKLLFKNTNIYETYADEFSLETDIGTIRETFFVNQLFKHKLLYPKQGDFLVDDKYIFEIGGKNKSFEQIKNIKNSFVVSDNMEIWFGAKIPLYLFGFLYL